jgi:hypothetical protein
MGEGFRADVVVDHQVILEVKAVATLLPAHEAQLQTYLRMSGIPIGLLLNSTHRASSTGSGASWSETNLRGPRSSSVVKNQYTRCFGGMTETSLVRVCSFTGR